MDFPVGGGGGNVEMDFLLGANVEMENDCSRDVYEN